jgi:large subunit ribosomal protein L21
LETEEVPLDDNFFHMIAVVKVGGHQAIVSSGEILEVDKLEGKVGESVDLQVLLMSNADGSNFQLGAPFLKDVTVKAKILEHGRGAKIRVFKMKPRKRYRRTQGHRQDYTQIEIEAFGDTKAAPKKAAAVKKEEPAAEKPAPKKAAVKKADKEA